MAHVARVSSITSSITNYKVVASYNNISRIVIDNGELAAFGADANEGISTGIFWAKTSKHARKQISLLIGLAEYRSLIINQSINLTWWGSLTNYD